MGKEKFSFEEVNNAVIVYVDKYLILYRATRYLRTFPSFTL